MISETWVPERRYGVIPHDPVSVTTRSCITDPNERAGNRDTQDLSSGIEGTKGEPMVSDLDRWTISSIGRCLVRLLRKRTPLGRFEPTA